MAEEVAALVIRLEATQARFERDMQRAERVMRRSSDSIERRAATFNSRVSNSLVRTGAQYRQFGQVVQQAGFQVGDFAVQVASGQGVLRPFIQQGTQLISMFGPWGAVIGAAGAVVGALATSFLGAGDAADSLSDALSALEQAGASVDDLNAQIANSSGVVREALIRERDATVDLLRARLELARQQVAGEEQRLRTQAENQARRNLASPAFGSEVLEGIAGTVRLDPRDIDRQQELILQNDPERAVNLRSLQRQIAVTERGLEELRTATETPVDPLFSVGTNRERSSRGGGRAASGRDLDAIQREIDAIKERRDALQREQQVIQVSEREQVRLTAAYEAQRIVEELLNKARAEGVNLTPQQIEQAKALGAEIESLTVANYDMKEAIEAQNRAAEEAKKRQEDLARSITDTADRFLGAIQQAESFADALKMVGIEALRLAVQGLGNQGPLAGLLGNIIPALIGGAAGFSVSSGGNLNPYGNPGSFVGGGSFPSFSFVNNAKGNAFRGGNVIPFARGGIVRSPTLFPMANGAGLMGEAGPEAVMPLRKGPGGRLGVDASGAGVTVNVINNAGAEIGVQQRRTQSGQVLEIMVDRMTAQKIGQGGSRTAQALEARNTIVGR